MKPSVASSPVAQFLSVETAGGIALLGAALLALVWSNSSCADTYARIWAFDLSIGAGGHTFTQPLLFWISDGLMFFFFWLAGLEIRRELHDGALASVRQAALPLVAALGGVLLPVLIFLAFNVDTERQRGWAIPMATDIAFAVGVLSLLGRRVPVSLRILLLAIALIDDIVAIVAIALFYSKGIAFGGLAVAGTASFLFALLQRSRTRSVVVAILLGLVIWAGLLAAGVHPALAGVILGLLTQARDVQQIEKSLHPWVAFGVMPLFALANAGVSFESVSFETDAAMPVVAGIVLGLLVGKPLGIVLSSALALKLGWCALPADINLKRLAVIGCFAGIGFTMSIFVSHLAFDNPQWLSIAKLAILAGSSVAAIVGLSFGYYALREPDRRLN